MNLTNQSLGLSQVVIDTELYSPSKSIHMCYPFTGRNEVDMTTKFCTALVDSQTFKVCQGSYGR